MYVFGLRQRKRPQRKSFLPKCDPLAIFDDHEFKRRYWMNKNTFFVLLNKLKNELKQDSNRNNPVNPQDQLLIVLRFYATGSFQIVGGDLIGVSQSTISRIVMRVSIALAKKRQQYIKFPPPSEESKVSFLR